MKQLLQHKKVKALLHAGATGVKILFKTALLLPIFVAMLWLDLTTAESAAHRENQLERDSAIALLNGKPLAGTDQMNERLLLSQLIQNLQKPFDTIAVGSSRVMQLSSEIVGTDNFFNCGLSGADYRDIINVYYQFEKAGMLPKNMIISLDPWLLNADPTKLHRQSDAEMFREFISLRLGYPVDKTAADTNEEPPFTRPFTPAAVQHNLKYLLRNNEPDLPPPLVEGDLYSQTAQVKMPDGTALYPAVYRNADPAMVDERARLEATTFLNMDGFSAPDPELCMLFHQFISYVRSQGVNVIFVLMPYHPLVYTYAREHRDSYPGFFLTEPWYTRYAKMYGIPLYGSYNPFITDNTNAQFYDGLHIRGEGIPQFFPGMPTIVKDQKTGDAFSPWLMGEAAVSPETAHRLIVERYEIPPEEPVRIGLNEMIDGTLCYQLHRYSSSEDNAILLATYAVSRQDGVIYRWDTDTDSWALYRWYA